jgi:hypothetical protein
VAVGSSQPDRSIIVTTFRPAPAVARIADDLIAKHHPELEGVRIEYVFRDPPTNTKGKQVWGSARKISGLNAYLATPSESDGAGDTDDLFVIEIAEKVWGALKDTQRIALVDHELSHCTIEVDEESDEVTLRLLPHDLEEFRGVIERHGLWEGSTAAFGRAMQPHLFELAEA